MRIVTPSTPTSLLLDMTYMPFGVATAKGAFYGMLKGRGKGLDAYGVPYDWNQMISGNISTSAEQPCMRSAPKNGVDVAWPIPTVFVANHRFFFKPKKNREDNLPPLGEVYDFYDGMCCFCGEKIKHIRDASREHVHSRAHGGHDGIRNIVLAHKICNSLAGSDMPKLDHEGNEIIPKMKVYPSHFVLPRNVPMRDEWKPFLFLS